MRQPVPLEALVGLWLENRLNFDFLGAELSVSQFMMRQGVGVSSSGLVTKSVHILEEMRSIVIELSNSSKGHYLL